LVGDERSEKERIEAENSKYILRTKPVKILKIPINASSIPPGSTALIKQFVRPALLKRYDVATIELLNEKFRELNKQGVYAIKDKKCNFDVEIGIDMLLDCERNNARTFVLWSGDSDFADSIQKLLTAGKKVFLFATAKRIASELNELNEIKENGLYIFDIADLKEFICWSRESAYGRTKGPVAEAF
jgi:uncharacterized LabA/DUF88 family protein